MSLGECMEKHTHRQYRSFIIWLDNELDNPSRSDNYLMQIVVEIRRLFHKDPKSVTLDQARLKFSKKPQLSPEEIARQKAEHSRRTWLGWLGLGGKAKQNEQRD